MDFALFMERYGYKLLLVGVVGGLFVALFDEIIRGLMVLGFTRSEAVLFVVFFLIVTLIAAVVRRVISKINEPHEGRRPSSILWWWRR